MQQVTENAFEYEDVNENPKTYAKALFNFTAIPTINTQHSSNMETLEMIRSYVNSFKHPVQFKQVFLDCTAYELYKLVKGK